MEAKDYLKDYIKKTAPILDEFFALKEKEAAKISPLASEMIKIYRRFVGGKNIRGALIKLGYECFGGKDEKAILRASVMVEILHSLLLMHDDIMDQDALRRGMPTIHIQYEQLHRKRYFKRSPQHYGICMGINLGDAGFALFHLLIVNSPFPAEIKVKVLRRLEEIILQTAFGQAIDVTYENIRKVTEEDIMRVHHYKTADYTITGPLQYGALFAGAEGKKITRIENYGLPVGIAFQLRDDELGLFSDRKSLGKPVGSDVRENKNTLLHIKALDLATPAEKEFLERAYGNRNLTPEETERVKEITVKTGALEYSRKLARSLTEQGKKFVPEITKDPELRDTLCKMADFMIERES